MLLSAFFSPIFASPRLSARYGSVESLLVDIKISLSIFINIAIFIANNIEIFLSMALTMLLKKLYLQLE